MRRAILAFVLALATVLSFAQESPETGSYIPGQAAADVLREFAGADGAFLAAGLLNKTYQKDNLASLLQFPTDQVMILSLTGSEVKKALEKAVWYYPQPNVGFLQLSGIDATFSRSAAPGDRIQNVTVNGSKLEEKRVYTIAVPSSLARGGLGFFKVWDTSKITKTFDKATLETVLRGKHSAESAPRWSVSD